MIWIMLLMILYLCLRVFRYRIASSAAALRLSWYAYYVPLMLVPALFLMVCFRISSTGLKSVKWDERLLLIPGGILASLALALPSVIIILIIARFLARFRQSKLVEGAFYGLRPASIAMISAAGLNVAKIALVNLEALTSGAGLGGFFIWKALILAVLIFIGLRKLKWSPILFIAISAVVGIIFKF